MAKLTEIKHGTWSHFPWLKKPYVRTPTPSAPHPSGLPPLCDMALPVDPLVSLSAPLICHGDTSLSYFPCNTSSLSPLCKQVLLILMLPSVTSSVPSSLYKLFLGNLSHTQESISSPSHLSLSYRLPYSATSKTTPLVLVS